MENHNERSEEHRKAGDYFDRSGELFDSLYSVKRGGRFMRPINLIFRRDIYERYLLTIRHLREVGAASVLDIGVGGARYAAGYLEAGVNRVVGVDISSKMLQFAREHVAGLKGAEDVFEFVHADVDEFETEERFDVVVAMGFFDYIPDTARVLRRLRELCVRSVIASFPSISLYRTPIRKVRYRLKNCPVFFFRKPDISSLSNQVGFNSCDITKIRGAGMDYVAAFRR